MLTKQSNTAATLERELADQLEISGWWNSLSDLDQRTLKLGCASEGRTECYESIRSQELGVRLQVQACWEGDPHGISSILERSRLCVPPQQRRLQGAVRIIAHRAKNGTLKERHLVAV
jgi:hypothetical protein